MELMLDTEIEIKVYVYDTEQERDESILEMEKLGYTARKFGEYNFANDNTVVGFLEESNWEYFAEFSKEERKFATDSDIYYETDVYFTDIQN